MSFNDDDTENYSIDIDMMTLPENDDTEKKVEHKSQQRISSGWSTGSFLDSLVPQRLI